MDRKSTFIMVGLLLLGVIFFLVILFTRNGIGVNNNTPYTATTTDWTNAPAEPRDVLVTPKTTVTAKHAYQNGVHIVAGEIPLPTPCHILEATGTVSSDKKQVFIELASNIKTDDICAQVITPARFKVNVKAAQGAKMSATLNRQEVILNLIEASPDENLDNFELYIKG